MIDSVTPLSNTIIELVDVAYKNVQGEWTQWYIEQLPQNLAMRQFKTVSLNLPRGYGISTAAIDLWDRYPTSFLFYPNDIEKQHAFCEFEQYNNQQFQTIDNVYTLPGTLDLFLRDCIHHRGTPLSQLQLELVIFDGVSRMKKTPYSAQMVDDIMTFLNPYTKLFVLLG